MPDLKPDATAFWILQFAGNTTFRPLLDVAVDTLASKIPTKSPEDCAEIAEKQLPEVIRAIEAKGERDRADGIEKGYELSLENDTAHFRIIRTEASTLLDELLKISDKEFVRFCLSLLRKMGGKTTLLDQTGDGGVDFVACDIFFPNNLGPAPPGGRLRVIGQAKHYSRGRFVSEPEVRDFVGGALRRVSDHTDDAVYRRAVLAAVIFAYWTTGEFNRNAKDYALAVGLWNLSGLALSQFAMRLGCKKESLTDWLQE